MLKKRKNQKATAKTSSPLKTAVKVAGHQAMDKECPIILKKQKKPPANDTVEAKGFGDRPPVPSKSTKSKHRKSAAKGPLVTRQSGKLVVKAIAIRRAFYSSPRSNCNPSEHQRYRRDLPSLAEVLPMASVQCITR